MAKQLTCRIIRDEDLEVIVNLHVQGFQDFFLTQLGEAFLKQFYHLALKCETSVKVISHYEDKPVGFAIGFLQPDDFNNALRKNLGKFIFPILAAFIRKPYLLRTVTRRFWDVFNEKKTTFSGAQLSSITTIDNKRGFGTFILECFLDECRNRGVDTITALTDYDDNERVRKFYSRHGFIESKKFTRGKRNMIYLKLELAE